MAKTSIWTYQEAINLLNEHGGSGWVMVDSEGVLSYSGINPRQHAHMAKSATMEELRYAAKMDQSGYAGAFAAVTTHFPGTEREDIEVG